MPEATFLFPADSLEGKEGHFTRKKSEEIGNLQKNADFCIQTRERNRKKDTQEDRPPGCRFNVKV